MSPGRALAIALVLAAATTPRRARAQAFDFATCSTATTTATTCTATTGACCTLPSTAGADLLKSGTDYALVIPLDYCHQAGSASPTTGAAPTWCSKPTSGGGMTQAYGLVYRLMQNGIPVYWVVNPSKDPPALGSTNGASVEIPTDIDMWIMSTATTTPPAPGTALTSCSTCAMAPVKHMSLGSSGTFGYDTSWTYDKRQFPIRGSAFVIAAKDRARFNAFIRRQRPYTGWAANRSCGGGASCQDFSSVDMFEIQPTATVGWTDFTANQWRPGEVPIAATLAYNPPRIARVGPTGVSQKWLQAANLLDPASPGCKTGAFAPSDAVYCDLTDSDVAAGTLISGNFSWLWLTHQAPSCGTTMTQIRSFLTYQPGVRAAGNLMAIADATDNENCPGQQLLGAEQSGTGLESTNGNSGSSFIVRYPANLLLQWGDAEPDFASGQGGSGWAYYGGSSHGYNAAFAGANTTLRRLATIDAAIDAASGSNTICIQQKASATCDVAGGANGDNVDVAAYGRFQNGANNGLVLYLPGSQVHQHTSELRMLLDGLLALPLGTIPVGSIHEVSRASPIVATLSSGSAIVQGTFENVVPLPPAPTFTVAGDAQRFRFPHVKGHVRAVAAANVSTASAPFSGLTTIFDAANGIPTPSYGGCSAYFTGGCRTVFTTTVGGLQPPRVLVKQSNLSVLGPLMASNLTTTEWSTLVQRVLAGYEATPGNFVPRLGGVDRSTVAVIGSSTLAGSARPTIAYFGATDGMLHAVCASVQGPCDALGRELWAYIPRLALADLRYNTARIDGSPRVVDMFGDFDGDGRREFHTVLMFQTGTGGTLVDGRTPGVYALDVTDPANPTVIWEYTMTSVTNRGAYELGQGLQLAAGRVLAGATLKNVVFAQTNNAGTAGAGVVTTAIEVETGAPLWQTGYTYPAPRSGGNASVPATGIPGGAVGVDKGGTGNLTDIVLGTLYGDVFQLDAATGANRHGSNPLFRFSTDYHPIGAPPSIYSSGGAQFALVVSGGYADQQVTSWSGGATQYAVSVSLSVPATRAPLDEASGAPRVPFAAALGSNEKAYAQALVVGDEVFLTTDTVDVNAVTYGTAATSGHVYRINLANGNATGSTVEVAGGAGSVANSGTALYTGSADEAQRLSQAASTATGPGVDPIAQPKVSRKLWLRSM